MFQSVEAQIFNGTTIDSGTIYDRQGLGTYNLSGGSLTLDGSSIFGGGTTIQWNVPTAGGTLDFGSTLITTTGGDLFLTGNPVDLPGGFTISVGGSLEINNPSFNPSPGNTGGSTITISSNDQKDLQQVIEDQGINYVQTSQPGITLNGYVDQPFSFTQAVPEPSTWPLLIGGLGLLVLMARFSRLPI